MSAPQAEAATATVPAAAQVAGTGRTAKQHEKPCTAGTVNRPVATSLQVRIDAAFADAEARGRCATARSDAMARALIRRAQRDLCISPAPGLYVRSAYWDELNPRERAHHLMHDLGELHPAWTFRSWAAALAHGIDVPYPLLGTLPIIAERNPGPAYPVLARHPQPGGRTELVGGVRAVDLLSAVGETLRQAPFSYALAVADAALHGLDSDAADAFLEDLHAERRGKRGSRRAAFLLRYVDRRAESGGESRVRAFLIAGGYELPDLQVTLRDPCDPTRTVRVDYLWYLPDGRRIVGEFDGMAKYRDPALTDGEDIVDILVRERQRESRITLLGLPVLRFTFHELARPVLLHRLLETAGIPRDAERARVWRESWRRLE